MDSATAVIVIINVCPVILESLIRLMLIRGNPYDNVGYQIPNGRDTKLDRFLTKNQHITVR